MKRLWLSKEAGIFHTPSGHTWFRGTVPGRGRLEFSISKDRLPLRDAIRRKDALLSNRERKEKFDAAREVRFEDLAREVIEEKRTKSGKTLESAVLHLEKHLIPWMNDRYPYLEKALWKDRGESIWQEYIEDKRRERPGVKFLNHRKHLRMVLLRAFERGIIPRKVKLYDPDPAIEVGQVLSFAEMKRLYQTASPSLRDQIQMAYTMGLRKSEILRLEWARVNFESSELLFRSRNTKTRKPRVVPMNKWVRATLLRRHESKVGPFVFASRANPEAYQATNKTAWRACKRRAQVTARFHDLRHTFITLAVRRGMNPILICKYAGVSQEVMASVYCHLDTSDLRRLSGEVGETLGESLE